MSNPLLSFALTAGKLLDPANLGQMAAALLCILLAIKCFSVARKARVQREALIALGIILLLWPLLAAAFLLEVSPALMTIVGATGLLVAAASLILAISGLVQYYQRRSSYERGRNQAICAILVSFLFIGQVVYSFAKTTVGRKEQPVRAENQSEPFELPEFNLRFQHPGAPWIALDAEAVNPDTRLVLTQRRPQRFIMVIPEIPGAESSMTLSTLIEVVQANVAASAVSIEKRSREAAEIAGIPGERFSIIATVEGQRLHYEFWCGLRHGLSVQVILFGAEKDGNRLREIHRKFLAGMELIDPDRVFTLTGELIDGPLHFPEEGFSLALPQNRWMKVEAANFPEAAFRASSLDDGNVNIIRMDLQGLRADADAIVSALLGVQDLSIENETVISKRDSQGPDGILVRDLVFALEDGESRVHDYYRIYQRADQVIAANAWNDSSPPGEQWHPESVLESLSIHKEIPSLLYETLPPERVVAQSLLINELGIFYYRRNDYEKALSFFRLASSIAPADSSIATNAIESLRQMEDLTGALAEAEKHLPRFPENSDVHADYARTLVALERPLDAEPVYASLFEEGYHDDDVLFDYINLLIDLDREDSALTLIEREAAERPTRKLRLWHGQVARMAGDYRAAEAAFAGIAEEDGWDSQLFREIVRVFQTEGDHLKALDWLDKQEEQTGASFDLWMGRGRSRNELQQHLDARESYRQALKIRPDDDEAEFLLRELEALLEKTDEEGLAMPAQ